jgi:myo-inositol 2-dehydrogenase/D-chiro-inositol 1-dehydrogenase
MATEPLRVAVVGAGLMGADHIDRITNRISGAVVAAVIEPDAGRAAAAVATAPGAVARPRIEDAIEKDGIDAVLIATPGQFHEPVLRPALEAQLAILCEKPLTPDVESSRHVLELEQKLDRPHIQVGFMRRFDAEYIQLRKLIESGDAGQVLALHCAHRNPSVNDYYSNPMLINDSVVHEFDVVPWLVGESIVSVEVKQAKRNSLSPAHLQEPILVLLETESGVLVDVEMNVSAQFGYQVTTQAVFEKGVAEIGRTSGLQLWQAGRFGGVEHESFKTRFAAAYDHQIQRWVDAVHRGTIDGPSAWDGYRAAALCEAGVRAQETGERVVVEYIDKPAFYEVEN